MTLESIEKLRGYAMVIEWATDDARNMWTEAVDSVEHEIERDYMKLPVDADGVPIRIGDLLECSEYGNQTERFTVYGYTTEYSTWTGDIATLMATNENSTEFYCDRCRHVRPRTIEDVLKAFFHDALDADAFCTVRLDDVLAKYAAELRELMEVGK